MNVAVKRAPLPDYGKSAVSARASVFARLEVLGDFAAAEPVWRALERTGAVLTPYQRYDFLHPWHRHLGARAGVRPFIVVGYDAAGTPVLLCPFGLVRHGPLRVLSFLGGRHANFNMALWRRDVADITDKADLAELLSQIAMTPSAGGADLVVLSDQPRQWDGFCNPFLLWPHQPSPSFGYRGTLQSDYDGLMHRRLSHATRKKLRRKLRTLLAHGEVQFRRAATPEQAHDILDVFCAQKVERMRELGISNIFAAPGTRAFIEELATVRAQGRPPLIELYALSAGDTIVATIGGMVGGERFCAMFNSITSEVLSHESPGDHLLCNLMQSLCERGLNYFDLGVGDARYKRMFCDESEPLFDCVLPLTPLGRVLGTAIRFAYDAKRVIKSSPQLWRMVQTLRHGRRFLSAARGLAAR